MLTQNIVPYVLTGGTSPQLTTASSPLTIDSGDVYSNNWADYSGTSSIVGMTSFTTKYIYTKKVGKTVFVNFNLSGTSNAVNITFTLPYAHASTPIGGTLALIYATTNSTIVAGILTLSGTSSTVSLYSSVNSGVWTNGASAAQGQFFYQSA